MKDKFINLYMDFAKRVALLSHAKRLQVGAVIVKDDTVISYGYNGMPSGWDNDCEVKIPCIERDFNGDFFPDAEVEFPILEKSEDGKYQRYKLKSRSEVLHAERNALDKLTKRGGVGGADAALFCTHAPCMECAKSIYGAGIKELYYSQSYRTTDGLDFLKKCGILVEQIGDN